MEKLMQRLWSEEHAQDIAEYAVMLAVILVLVVGTIRLIGGSSNNVFSSVASSIGQCPREPGRGLIASARAAAISRTLFFRIEATALQESESRTRAGASGSRLEPGLFH